MALWNLSAGVFLTLVWIGGCVAVTTCVKRDVCSCHTDGEKVIDLRPLASRGPFKASKGTDKYEWNPCTNFKKEITDPDDPGEKELGSFQDDGGYTHVLGVNGDLTTDSKVMKDDLQKEVAVFIMNDGRSPNTRLSSVFCYCPTDGSNEDPKFEFHSVDPDVKPFDYIFHLTASECCPRVPGSDDEGEGLSVGSILCIGFFAVLLIYFIVGVVIQSAVRKAQGIERVPNVTFWSALPGLIKDGCKFTFTCGKASSSGYGKL